VEVSEGNRPPPTESPDADATSFHRTQGAGTDPTDQKVDKPDPAATDPSLIGQIRRLDGQDTTAVDLEAAKTKQEKGAFEKAAEEIREAVRDDPTLAVLAKQLAIDMTPEGLRIQIMDEIKQPMFASGSALPNDRAIELLRKVVPFLQKLPEGISIGGYTDSTAYAGVGKTNWELSSERANATRRLLTDAGLQDSRIKLVTGHADRDPLLPADPLAPANRRIAIVVLREAHAPKPIDPAH
jgi:chemotaxis protein MotB